MKFELLIQAIFEIHHFYLFFLRQKNSNLFKKKKKSELSQKMAKKLYQKSSI